MLICGNTASTDWPPAFEQEPSTNKHKQWHKRPLQQSSPNESPTAFCCSNSSNPQEGRPWYHYWRILYWFMETEYPVAQGQKGKCQQLQMVSVLTYLQHFTFWPVISYCILIRISYGLIGKIYSTDCIVTVKSPRFWDTFSNLLVLCKHMDKAICIYPFVCWFFSLIITEVSLENNIPFSNSHLDATREGHFIRQWWDNTTMSCFKPSQ